MENKDDGIPKEILKELDVNEVEEILTEFEVSPVVEHHQIKLPVPKRLVRDFELNFQKGKKIKLKFNKEKKELIYKIR